MYPKWLFVAVLKIGSYNIFYMVIQICNSLFKASLEEKNEKQKKKGWLARDILFNFLLLSLPRFHENESMFFAYLKYLIIMAWNPDKITLGKLYSHVAGVTIKNRNLNSQLRVAMRSPL